MLLFYVCDLKVGRCSSCSAQTYLREVEDTIGLWVFARHHIEPQLPHKEDLVGYVDWAACGTRRHAGTHTGKRYF